MNKELAEVIRLYSIASDKELSEYLLGKSKNTLIAVLTDLLTMYINDKNSSTIREFLTVTLGGYKHTESKIGYNGYKHSSIIGGKPVMCEAKPKNFDTEELEKFKRGERRTLPSKLNGGGNFTDYTLERLKRDSKENLNMLVSGFVDGKLIYILEFPFNCKTFMAKLKKHLNKRFPGGDVSGQFLRSAYFDYNDYMKCKDLKVLFLLNKTELEKYRVYIIKNFYEILLEVAENG